MTVSEFMFLAIGLVLGVASGVAFITIIRARPPARREVRLTVSQDAIPHRRATTLADDAFVASGSEPARGGPADRRDLERPAALGAIERRTDVLAGRTPAVGTDRKRTFGGLIGMPIAGGADPMLGALRGSGRPPVGTATFSLQTTAVTPAAAPAATAAAISQSPTPIALLDAPTPAGSPETPDQTAPCAEERRLADERCELATRAKAQASVAADTLRHAQRAYDSHIAAADAAAAVAHPRAVRSLKEEAQQAFRAASRGSTSREAVEAAARTWLQEINRINRESSRASHTASREREAASAIGATLERLSLDADAARVRAEMAGATCLAARTAVAACDERATTDGRTARMTPPPPTEPVLSAMTSDEALGIALEGGTAPRIFRLLRGDTDAMTSIVASLAGDKPEEEARWKLALAGLLDAINADAIEQAYLRFAPDHPFWGPYTVEQQRDITRALASLGYRFDGLGGWVGERLPTQRELALALGYAGFDPMRLRVWPDEQQTAELFRKVEVAADEYLAYAAGDLTLAEMVDMLGRRADSLVDLWNQWGRIRPLLLEEA